MKVFNRQAKTEKRLDGATEL